MDVSRREILASLAVGLGSNGTFSLASATKASQYPGPRTISHRRITSNSISMHIAEQGNGPLIILCHGFPESWYSWRHQIPALADAGYHVVAPDMRGYGGTDAPSDSNAYSITDLVGDMVGIVAALGETHATIMGHDWGATVAWHSALLRPDIFHAVVAMSVPYKTAPIRASFATSETCWT